MQFGATGALGTNEACLFEHREMLRDGLPGHPDPVMHGESAAYLEQALAIALRQLVQDQSPGRVGKRVKDIAHTQTIRK